MSAEHWTMVSSVGSVDAGERQAARLECSIRDDTAPESDDGVILALRRRLRRPALMRTA